MAVIKAAQLDTFRIELAQALQEHRLEDARRLIRELSPARVASVLTEAPEDVVLPLLGLLDRRTAGRVVGAMPAEFAAAAVTRLETQELAGVFAANRLCCWQWQIMRGLRDARAAWLPVPEDLARPNWRPTELWSGPLEARTGSSRWSAPRGQ